MAAPKALTAVERIALQVKAIREKADTHAKSKLATVNKDAQSIIDSIPYNQPNYRIGD